MKSRCMSLLMAGMMTGVLAAGSMTAMAEDVTEAVTESVEAEESDVLADGVYSAEFNTDSGMFHANEAHDGKGLLTVENGEMTFHVSLASKNILNLYLGLAEDAKEEGAELLEPTVDTVTYSDGITEEVFGFDFPVEKLDEEFDLALIGKKGKWYDHKVSISAPEAIDEETAAVLSGKAAESEAASEAE